MFHFRNNRITSTIRVGWVPLQNFWRDAKTSASERSASKKGDCERTTNEHGGIRLGPVLGEMSALRPQYILYGCCSAHATILVWAAAGECVLQFIIVIAFVICIVPAFVCSLLYYRIATAVHAFLFGKRQRFGFVEFVGRRIGVCRFDAPTVCDRKPSHMIRSDACARLDRVKAHPRCSQHQCSHRPFSVFLPRRPDCSCKL